MKQKLTSEDKKDIRILKDLVNRALKKGALVSTNINHQTKQ